MTPWQLAGKTEHSHQRALFAWANCAASFGFEVAADPRGYNIETRVRSTWAKPFPPLALLFAVHNQGHGDKIRGGIAKAEGVKAGIPDVMFPFPQYPFAGLFIELKTPDKRPVRGGKGGVSDEQLETIKRLIEVGYRCHVAYGWYDAVSMILDYLKIGRYVRYVPPIEP